MITVTIAFFDKIQGNSLNPCLRGLISGSWVAFAVSIVAALTTLMGVTTSIDVMDQIEDGEKAPPAAGEMPSAFDTWIVIPAVIMLIAFLAAIGLTVAAGMMR